MPLPMVHLAIANKFFEGRNVPHSFYLGSIAPDAIHMRKDNSKEDKNRTHFNAKQLSPNSMENHYKEFINQDIDQDWKWFVKGYFTHILTDHYWVNIFYSKYKDKALKNSLTNKEIITTYWSETEAIDFYLYETKEWKNKVWNSLIHTKLFSMNSLLSKEEINYWRLRTIHWFDLIAVKPDIEEKYITKILVEEFINQTADKVKSIIKNWDNRILETNHNHYSYELK